MKKFTVILLIFPALFWVSGILSCEDPLYGEPNVSEAGVGLSGQAYKVGDTVEDFTMQICGNGSGAWTLYDWFHTQNGGTKKVILINCFATWWGPCQSEAPVLETLASEYADSGVVVVAGGFDWDQPYSCSDWASNFNLTYTILNDESYSLYGAFGSGYIPHNVIIDHNMVVRHSDAGFSLSGITDLITTILAEIKAEGSWPN